MQPEIVVAICSLLGTLVGSLAGIMTANKLTTYRLEQLEEKVKKHNNLVERMAIVEQSTKSAHHRIDEIVGREEPNQDSQAKDDRSCPLHKTHGLPKSIAENR